MLYGFLWTNELIITLSMRAMAQTNAILSLKFSLATCRWQGQAPYVKLFSKIT